MLRATLSIALLAAVVGAHPASAADGTDGAPLFTEKKTPPAMSLRPGEGDIDPNAIPHSCYGDSHEKDEELNAFYPITDEEIALILGKGPGS